jgi:hypothetical protein
MTSTPRTSLRRCLREPIPEIEAAAGQLAEAAKAHLAGNRAEVVSRLKASNLQSVRDWTESIWGKSGPFAVRGPYDSDPPVQRLEKARMPGLAGQRQLHAAGGYYCRFCSIPVIRREVREFFRKNYPEANLWGTKNSEQHAGFQCMWAQYDHVVPHARGGTNDISNLVVTCAPCNYGRMNYTLREAGLQDPRCHPPRVGPWAGLEEVLSANVAQ